MKNLNNVKLKIQAIIGDTELTLEDLENTSVDDVVILDQLAGEEVMLTANGETVAKGKVVYVQEKYGIRVTEIL